MCIDDQERQMLCYRHRLAYEDVEAIRVQRCCTLARAIRAKTATCDNRTSSAAAVASRTWTTQARRTIRGRAQRVRGARCEGA